MPPFSSGSITLRTPAFAYPGGKVRLRSTLVNMMPQSGATYCEPFAGRGNVYFQVVKTLDYATWMLNDIQTKPFFDALVSHGATSEVPERTVANYRKVRSTHPYPESYLLEPYLCFAGATYLHGGYKGDGRGGVSQPTYRSHIREANRLLIESEAVVTDYDYRDVLSLLGKYDFAYLDPPYLGCDTRAYDADTLHHEELVAILRKAKFKWMLSEFRQPLYVKAFGEPLWTRNVQLVGTNVGSVKQRRNECVWTNYKLGKLRNQ
jgi:site-specific DNA-adenine methylase